MSLFLKRAPVALHVFSPTQREKQLFSFSRVLWRAYGDTCVVYPNNTRRYVHVHYTAVVASACGNPVYVIGARWRRRRRLGRRRSRAPAQLHVVATCVSSLDAVRRLLCDGRRKVSSSAVFNLSIILQWLPRFSITSLPLQLLIRLTSLIFYYLIYIYCDLDISLWFFPSIIPPTISNSDPHHVLKYVILIHFAFSVNSSILIFSQVLFLRLL